MVCLLAFMFAGAANAALVTGDFRTESNLPDTRTGSPLVYESLNQSIGAGYELDNGDFLENPDGWGGGVVWMDFNESTNILTLVSQDRWDFETFDAYISNIVFDTVGEYISAVSLVSNGLTNPSFLPTLSFSDNSLHVSYDYTPDVFNFTGGISTFQIETATTTVPEPSAFLLMSLSLAGLGFFRRNKV